jgi:ferrochelatase
MPLVAKQSVLLLAHGTPDSVAQIPEYLRNVTGGRTLPESVVEEIERRYALIGRSPLTEITRQQARLAESELAAGGLPVPVYFGMRNWHPYISETVTQMRADGVEEAAVLCLAPQNSRTSVGLYRRAVEAAIAAEAPGLRIDFTESWAHHPLLIEAFAERLRPAWGKLTVEYGPRVPVLFTAHSVPVRTVQLSPSDPGAKPDPYADEARQTAALVTASVREIQDQELYFAFQSQGASGGPWLGPTVEETIDSIAASGAEILLLQPIGFLADHVEILYDIDIQFREYAAQKGLRLERTESLNDSATLAKAVADVARQGLARLAAARS